MMKRRILSGAAALALCLSILPVPAQAWVLNSNGKYVYNGQPQKITSFQLTLDGVRTLKSGEDFEITKHTDLDGNETDCINVGPVLMHMHTDDATIGALNNGQIRYDIVQAPLTITGLGGNHAKEYDGSADCDGTGLEIEFEGSFNNDDVTIKAVDGAYAYSDDRPGADKEITLHAASYALEGEKAGNYYIAEDMPDTLTASVGTIRKAGALVPKTGDLAVTNRQVQTYTYSLDTLLPEPGAGMSLGEVTYALDTVSLGSYYTGGAEIENQTLTLPIQAVESGVAEGIGTVTVIIHSENFEDMTAAIHVRSVNKTVPTGEPTLSANTLTYGQALSAITLSGSMQHNGTPVSGTFAWSSPDNRPAAQESCAAAWTFTPDDSTTYATVNGTALIQVLPASLADAVVVLEPTVFRYDGAVNRPVIASVTLAGTPLTADVDYTAAIPEGTEAGSYTVTLTGKGNYTGTAAAAFTVHPVEQRPLGQKDDDGHALRLEVETGLSTVPAALAGNAQLNTTEKIEAVLRAKVAEVMTDAGEQIAVFDVTLQYKDSGGTWHNVEPGNFPAGGVTAVLPYPAGTGPTGYTFTVQHLISSGAQAGTMETLAYTLTADGLQCRFSSLSPVAIGYQAVTRPNPQPTPGGGSGGGGSVSTYAVTVEKPAHGKVTSNRTSAGSGSTVTLAVTPDSGYVLDALTVTDTQGNEVNLTARGGGKYAFTMPGRAVTIKASFVPLPDSTQKPCDGGTGCPSRSFTDLGTAGTWYHEAVDYALRNGLMGGYGSGTFGPNDSLTRAQFARILFNKEGRPVVNYLLQYSDVAEGAWYTEAIRWAASRGIIGGYGSGMFGPSDSITREQLAVVLWRYAGSPAAAEKELRFADADKAGGYALEALCWAVENGIMSGKGGGILDPRGPATRAQTAQMLMRFLENE